MSCGVWEGLPSPEYQGWETFPTKKNEGFREVCERIGDGRDILADGRDILADGRDILADGRELFTDGRDISADGRETLADGRETSADVNFGV